MTGRLSSDIKEDELPPPPEGEGGGEGEGDGQSEGQEGAEDIPPPEAGAEGEEGKEKGADTGDGPRPRKKPRTGFNKRIGDLTARAKTAEETAKQYQEELEALRGQKGESDSAALHYGRQAWETKIELLTRQLKEANEASDAGAQAELTSKLAHANAQLARFPVPSKEPAERQPEKKPETRQPAEEDGAGAEEVPAHLQAQPNTPKAAWLETNAAWLDPQSPDYDPGMEAVARRFANKLEADLLRKFNRPDLIGSAWYFDRIDRHMATAFPEEYEMPAERQPPRRGNDAPPMRPGNGAVAGPTRPGGGGGRGLPNLSAEEKEMALMMPRKTHPDGKRFTDAEMLASYAYHKKNPGAGPVPVTFRGRNGG